MGVLYVPKDMCICVTLGCLYKKRGQRIGLFL